MQCLIRQFAFFTSCLLITLPVLAETPNLQPGLWAYTSSSTVEGPMNLPPQTSQNQECLKQEDLNKGVDMLNIPESCTVTQADVDRDRVDYSASCNMQGMTTMFNGYATFHGDRLKGKMSSEMKTPLGIMLMKTDYSAKRVGAC